jgi:hypothetical protein
LRVVRNGGPILFAAIAAVGALVLIDVDVAAALQRGRPLLNQFGARGQTIRYGGNDVVVVLVGGKAVEAAGCEPAAMPERRLEHYLVLSRTPRVFSLGVPEGLDRQVAALRRYFQRFRADAVVLWESPEDVRSRDAVARAHALVDQMAALSRANSAAFVTFWIDHGLTGPCIRGDEPAEPVPALMASVNTNFETHVFTVPPASPRSSTRRFDAAGIDAVMKELALTLIPRFSVGPTRPLAR